jgi:predicted transcriptional regulator
MSDENTSRTIQGARGAKRVRVGNVNLDTGEILEGEVPMLRPVKVKNFTQDYMIMFLQSFEKVAQDKALRGVPTSVLLYIVSKAQMKNWVQLQQQEIAEALGLKQPHVSRALKTLREKGLIEETTKLGKAKSYRISIEFGWRGAGKTYTQERKLRMVKGIEEAAEHAAAKRKSDKHAQQ